MLIDEIKNGESKTLEFKLLRPHDNLKWLKTVVAFANGQGGKIIFGIDDKTKEVIGVLDTIIFQEMDAICTAISDGITPTIIPDVYMQSIDNKTVIVVEVEQGKQRPYYLTRKGITEGVYIRVGATSRPSSRDITTQMYYDDSKESYDALCCKDVYLSQDDINALCTTLKEVAIQKAPDEMKPYVKTISKNVLENWNIICRDENGIYHPTNAYVFLLGKDSYFSYIQCAVFKGNEKGIFLDKREYDGPLWKQIEDAYAFVLRNIRLGCRVNGIYRNDIYELPIESIRELIVNAVMNCSFLMNSHIQVAIYDNRLEITSPGGFMSGVTVTKMKEGYSKIRNRALGNVFLYMNMIEGWGSGIPKLYRQMQQYGLSEPVFVDLEDALRIILYRDNTTQAAQDTTQATQDTTQATQGIQDDDTLTKKEKVVLSKLKDQPSLTLQQCANELDWKVDTVKYYIKRLKVKKRIERVGTSQKGYWKCL